jgi:hypothetical protein
VDSGKATAAPTFDPFLGNAGLNPENLLWKCHTGDLAGHGNGTMIGSCFPEMAVAINSRTEEMPAG